VVADYQRESPDRTVEALARDLRFSATDSPYHDTRSGYFGSGAARANVIVNVVYGDMSDEQWLAHAERLNPAGAVESALPFLRLHLPSGAVSRWGRGPYQVNALSLSSDRSIVAYSGSGGEVGVLRVTDRKAIYEKRRKGEHWGQRLLAGWHPALPRGRRWSRRLGVFDGEVHLIHQDRETDLPRALSRWNAAPRKHLGRSTRRG
jgi:hypothetical protein